MKLAEGVTSKLCLKIYSLEKWINTFVQKIYEKAQHHWWGRPLRLFNTF